MWTCILTYNTRSSNLSFDFFLYICMWLREISSCPCLTSLPCPAWLLLNKLCTPFYGLCRAISLVALSENFLNCDLKFYGSSLWGSYVAGGTNELHVCSISSFAAGSSCTQCGSLIRYEESLWLIWDLVKIVTISDIMSQGYVTSENQIKVSKSLPIPHTCLQVMVTIPDIYFSYS